MPETIVPYALTTRQRIKDRLTITAVSFDVLIDRLISSATDLIESSTNRRFKRTTYTNELYSVRGANPQYIFLKQIPVASVASLQYRAGTPSNPNWTTFSPDYYELLEDGSSGIIRVYGGLFTGFYAGINQIRTTYDAGYLIDFANAGTSTHTLPFDISDLCERIAVKLFKKRESEGRQSESFEGGAVQWRELLDEADKIVINKYRREPPFA